MIFLPISTPVARERSGFAASSFRHGFTLVEVVLAILIISGIMTVLLYFYQRAAMVRQTALEEAQFLAEARMVLDQISGEFRTARIVQDQFVGFEGTSNSVTFVCTVVPQMARWITSTNDPITLPPVSDLKQVHYGLLGGTNLLSVRGLDRSENPLLTAAFTTGTNATEFFEPGDTNALEEALITTNQLEISRLPLTARIQHLRFRYWNGSQWQETWSGMDLPSGVEISLGHEPAPVDTAEEDPVDRLRRVVFLPNSTHPDNVVSGATDEELAL